MYYYSKFLLWLSLSGRAEQGEAEFSILLWPLIIILLTSQSRLSFRLLLQSLPSMSQCFQVAFRSVLSFLPKNGSPIALEGGILPLRPLGELISLALAKKALPSSLFYLFRGKKHPIPFRSTTSEVWLSGLSHG